MQQLESGPFLFLFGEVGRVSVCDMDLSVLGDGAERKFQTVASAHCPMIGVTTANSAYQPSPAVAQVEIFCGADIVPRSGHVPLTLPVRS
jgi:hypothetical protein